MNFQEENPADKEAEEKEVNASQRGSRGEENALRASLEEHTGKGSPAGGRAVCSHPRHVGVLQASGLSTNCLLNPQPLCGEGSLTALRKRGWEGTAKAQVQVPDNPSPRGGCKLGNEMRTWQETLGNTEGVQNWDLSSWTTS